MTPAPTPTISTELRMRMEQRRDVTEHALEPHVDVHVGRFDLAGDVKLPRAGHVPSVTATDAVAPSARYRKRAIESHEFTERP